MREKAASRVGKFTRIRAKVAPVLEKEVERKLKDPIKQMGGLCLKFVCPGFTGVPDRIILLPGGRLVFVETKQKGKKAAWLYGVQHDRQSCEGGGSRGGLQEACVWT